MGHSPEVAELVDALLGTWRGAGHGGYPTIDSFDYLEETRISGRPDHPALHYEQRTWKLGGDERSASHWETGLIRLSSDGTATLNNAQGGRSETMAGRWKRTGSGWAVDLTSTGFAGDERVIAATRSLSISAGTLAYVHEMATTAHDTMSLHLRASLTRDPG